MRKILQKVFGKKDIGSGGMISKKGDCQYHNIV
jgi:hypothetical protein